MKSQGNEGVITPNQSVYYTANEDLSSSSSESAQPESRMTTQSVAKPLPVEESHVTFESQKAPPQFSPPKETQSGKQSKSILRNRNEKSNIKLPLPTTEEQKTPDKKASRFHHNDSLFLTKSRPHSIQHTPTFSSLQRQNEDPKLNQLLNEYGLSNPHDQYEMSSNQDYTSNEGDFD